MILLHQDCRNLTEKELQNIIENGGLGVADTTPHKSNNPELDGKIYAYHVSVGPVYLTPDEFIDYCNKQVQFNEARRDADFETPFAFFRRDMSDGSCHRITKATLVDEVVSLTEYDIDRKEFQRVFPTAEEQGEADKALFEDEGQKDWK